MSIISQLSSKVGDRSENSNRLVVIQCIENPDLLAEIAEGLRDKNEALVGDCAEIMTQVAEQHPEWIAPYAKVLTPLLSNKVNRVRWEAMHALELVTTLTPETITPLLSQLAVMLRTDTSVIVRDHATDALANYAATGISAAEKAYPLLKEALTVWDGKQAGHALKGLACVAVKMPYLSNELHAIAAEYSLKDRAVVRKAAQELLKIINAQSKGK